MIVPTAKKAAAVPNPMALSRSTTSGMNGSSAVMTRQANSTQSAAEIQNRAAICAEVQS